MKRYHELLLNVWREACRHIEISASTEKIAAVVAGRAPVRSLVVRRLDLQKTSLETVAVYAAGPSRPGVPPRTVLSADEMRQLTAWAGRRAVARGGDAEGLELLRLVASSLADAGTFAGPLWESTELSGVLIMQSAPHAPADVQYEDLLALLLDPFAAALENDRRLHEMRLLRDAAEADRRSLLKRLGRKELAMPIVGAEAGLRTVMERVDTVSRSDVPVLLLGETGTGKEVVARAIHDRSARHEGPFVRVNCGAIPPELIDSQLFGHERGSFTGASETRQGWFERADGGTLFLDEIGELRPAAQVRMLRVLQDGFMERVGGKRPIHVDVRIVAATHCDLAAMVRAERFREDLWYRVAVFPIAIPPLRERAEDIPALACHLAEKAATRFGLPLVMPTPADIRLLAAYAWPGNVRELGAVIDRAALLGNGRRLEVATALGAAPPVLAEARTSGIGMADKTHWAPDAALAPRTPAADPATTPDESLEDVVRRRIEAALRVSLGRIEGPFGAARKLKVNPHTLRSRMKRLGINWRAFRQPRAGDQV